MVRTRNRLSWLYFFPVLSFFLSAVFAAVAYRYYQEGRCLLVAVNSLASVSLLFFVISFRWSIRRLIAVNRAYQKQVTDLEGRPHEDDTDYRESP